MNRTTGPVTPRRRKRGKMPGWLFWLILGPLLAGLVYYAGWAAMFDMKKVSQMPQSTIIYDRNGYVIQRFYEQHRVIMDSKQIPELVRQAVVATEDQRFYWHPGVDPIGIVRAVYGNLTRTRIRSGASTITMQLARNSADMFEKTFDRKLKELFLALRIELAFNKDQILTFYLNRIFFGRQVYGIGAAAESYFWKLPKDLSLSEASMLAGIISGPNSFSPWKNPDKARAARARALDRMVEKKYITSKAAADCKAEPLVLRPLLDFPASHAILAVKEEMPDFLSHDQIYSGGLKVYTTIDLAFQRAAEEEMEQVLVDVEKTTGYRHTTRGWWRKLQADQKEKGIKKEDEESQPSPPYLQGAFVALSNEDGGVLALVGGRNYQESPLNRAMESRRQVGSTLKPFLYATAFNTINCAAFTRVDRSPFDLRRVGNGVIYDQGAPDYITIRQALQNSDNYCAMRVGLATGVDNFAMLLRQSTGIDIPRYPSSFLGACELTPMELVSAYTLFPTQGEVLKPYLIRKILDSKGAELYTAQPQRQRVLSPQISYQVHELLRGVVDEGTGKTIRSKYGLTGEIAGKTGTTNDYKDSWFVGYTSGVTAGIWVGLDKPAMILPGGYASRIALPAWARIMKLSAQQYPPRPFIAPQGLRLMQPRHEERVFWIFTKQVAQGRSELVRDDQGNNILDTLDPMRPAGTQVASDPRYGNEIDQVGDFFRKLFGSRRQEPSSRRPSDPIPRGVREPRIGEYADDIIPAPEEAMNGQMPE